MLRSVSLLTAFFLLILVPMSGQSGKFLIGGTMGFSYSADESNLPLDQGVLKTKTINFSGAPVFGYFFTKNFMAGIDFAFSLENMNADGGPTGSTKSRSLTLDPLVRYYFNSPFFAEARFIWGPAYNEINYADELFPIQDITYKSRKLGFGTGIGYDIKLSEGLRLEPMVYYTRYSDKSEELEITTHTHQVMVNLGLIYIL